MSSRLKRIHSFTLFNYKKSISEFPEVKARFPEISDTREFLLYGVPGTGKTLLSEWLAGETGFGLMKIDGGKLFSKFTGETNKVRRPIIHTFARRNREFIGPFFIQGGQ